MCQLRSPSPLPETRNPKPRDAPVTGRTVLSRATRLPNIWELTSINAPLRVVRHFNWASPPSLVTSIFHISNLTFPPFPAPLFLFFSLGHLRFIFCLTAASSTSLRAFPLVLFLVQTSSCTKAFLSLVRLFKSTCALSSVHIMYVHIFI